MKKSNSNRTITARYKGDTELEEFKEEMREGLSDLRDMVKSLGVIGKHSYDISKSNSERFDELEERLAEFGDAPATGRKSVSTRRAVDRKFEKGMGADETIEKSNDGTPLVDVDRARNQVLNMMDSMAFSKGYNPEMGEAMGLFEASGIIKPNIQKSLESEFKVKLVRNRSEE